jgi:hypothetical protein
LNAVGKARDFIGARREHVFVQLYNLVSFDRSSSDVGEIPTDAKVSTGAKFFDSCSSLRTRSKYALSDSSAAFEESLRASISSDKKVSMYLSSEMFLAYAIFA